MEMKRFHFAMEPPMGAPRGPLGAPWGPLEGPQGPLWGPHGAPVVPFWGDLDFERISYDF